MTNDMTNDMKLPDGATAKTCVYFPVCGTIFGCKKDNTKCEFSPGRYIENVLNTDYGVFGCTTCTNPCVAWTGAIPPNRCIRNDLDCQDNAKWVMLKPVDEEAIHGLRFQKEI